MQELRTDYPDPTRLNEAQSRSTVKSSPMRSKQFCLKLLVSLISTLLAFAALELAVRVYKHQLLETDNFLLKDLDLFRSAYPSSYDQTFGWIPKPGTAGRKNVWGTEVTILDDGIRSNGKNKMSPSNSPKILAVGDSFTFGDEVSDHQTWPASLERQLQVKVINAGVFGYGLDQMVLRAENLVDKYKPDMLIVGFIFDDVGRCGHSMRDNADKPYFEVHDQELVLKNSPVPPPRTDHSLGFVRGVLGYSLLAHTLMMRVAPRYWLEGTHNVGKREVTKENPQAIACLLMDRLEKLAVSKKIRVIVMGQYWRHLDDEEYKIVNSALQCVDRKTIDVLDLYDTLIRVKKENPAQFKEFYESKKPGGFEHMSAAGNEFVAAQLTKIIRNSQ